MLICIGSYYRSTHPGVRRTTNTSKLTGGQIVWRAVFTFIHCIAELSAIELHISPIQLQIVNWRYLQFNCRYLQFNCRYLQFNCRYLQINSVNKCEKGTCRFHIYSLNCRYLQIRRFGDISNSIGYISKYADLDISN